MVQTLVEITTPDGTWTATDNHPIWVQGQGWTYAGDILPGDHLIGADNTELTVTTVTDLGDHTNQTVYNLTVNNAPTYYVAEADGTTALVHNCGGPKKLIYDANGKHGPVARRGPRGREISRAPRGDCQAMLECSIQTGLQRREGIEPSTGKKVIFHKRREFEGTEWWHGDVPWRGLAPGIPGPSARPLGGTRRCWE